MPKAGTADKSPSPPQPKPDIHIQILPPRLETPKREAPQKTERERTAPPPTDTPVANVQASNPYTNTTTPSSPSYPSPDSLAPPKRAILLILRPFPPGQTSQNLRPTPHDRSVTYPGKIRDPRLTDFAASC
jgi:hypothetical protein